MENFLKETLFIDYSAPLIRETSSEIVGNLNDKKEIAVKLFYFVRDKIVYNPYTSFFKKEDYKSSVILKKGHGFCIQKAILLASFMRLNQIPTKLVFVDIKNYKAPDKLKNLFGDTYFYHCYLKLFIKGKWVAATPTFNIEMCKKFGYIPTEFDGENDSLLSRFNVDGELTFEYVNKRGEFDDMPFDEVVAAVKKELGGDKFLLWKNYVEDYERGKNV